jgi:hypothetical protein
MPELCFYCNEPGKWWCGCDCCDDKFMVCEDCGKDIPIRPFDQMNTIKDKEKYT